LARPAGSALLSDLAELTLLACTIRHNARDMRNALDRMDRIADRLEANRARLLAQNATAHLPPASGGKVPPDVRHPSGFASWQDLSGYLRDYGISSDDDHTCGLIEQAYNHWPNGALTGGALRSVPSDAGLGD
jgi:hypothetical protein